MYLPNSHEKLNEFINTYNEKIVTQALRAYEYYPKSELTDIDDYVVIMVEGYYCITKITDGWEPMEISTTVVPFDAERIYPLQEIKQTISFK